LVLTTPGGGFVHPVVLVILAAVLTYCAYSCTRFSTFLTSPSSMWTILPSAWWWMVTTFSPDPVAPVLRMPHAMATQPMQSSKPVMMHTMAMLTSWLPEDEEADEGLRTPTAGVPTLDTTTAAPTAGLMLVTAFLNEVVVMPAVLTLVVLMELPEGEMAVVNVTLRSRLEVTVLPTQACVEAEQ